MRLYMLDTDTVSHLVRGRTPTLDQRIASVPREQVCISAVTRGELLYGLKLKDGAQRLAQTVDQLLSRVRCLAWGNDAASQSASVAATLQKGGTPIGSMDAMIAGRAMSVGAVLVSHNGRHFGRVSGLVVEDWIRSD